MGWKYHQLWFCVCVLLLLGATVNSKDDCDAQATCKECLNAGGTCKWCADENYDETDQRRARCNTIDNLNKNGCKDIQIADGTVSEEKATFSDKVQLSPKKVKLTLRPGQSRKFTLRVQPAPNYPVRLYYLMDLSYSMKDDLENLKTLGREIAKEISKITKNFQLAFGTFVDKDIPPYSWLTQERACETCAPPIGFNHVFDFNPDPKKFEEAVTNQSISGNLDPPEGGFDALMQVTVCGDQIWPKDEYNRKIVIYVTDAAFHIAGDGKLGGITVPNDGECHLKEHMIRDKEGMEKVKYYTESRNMDYPSVSFLKHKMRQHNVIPIIAATAEMKRVYTALADAWSDLGTAFGVLSGDSSNIVDLVRDNYKKISSTIKVVSQAAPKHLTVKEQVIAGCNKPSADKKTCSAVAIGHTVDFDITVTATECPQDYKNGDNFKINVPGFGDVEIEVEYICDCACDLKPGIPNAPKCNTTGTFKCGICYCDPGRFGKFCQCDENVKEEDTLCIRPNSTDTDVCSGQGECVCGKCVCKKLFTGTYCQCNNYNCDRHDGKICGGKEQGVCKCGKCVCTESYYGDNCGTKNCTVADLSCVKDGLKCSDHGTCDCGICSCDPGYEGTHCEKCVRCDTRCKNEEDCARCHSPYEVGDPDVCKKCIVDNKEIILVNDTKGGRPTDIECKTQLNRTCYISFNVSTDTDIIYLKKTPECTEITPPAPPYLKIALTIIGVMVLIGLLLLLAWKLMSIVYQRSQVKALEQDAKAAQRSDQNPLFIPPQQTIVNPTYVGSAAT